MNANELANLQAFKTEDLTMWERNTTATMLQKQADRIGVLEANYKIQLNIVEKQQDYINQLEQVLKASIDLNKVSIEKKDKFPSASWWKGDHTCGGITENYGLGKVEGDV